jgi:hypothetical protein
MSIITPNSKQAAEQLISEIERNIHRHQMIIDSGNFLLAEWYDENKHNREKISASLNRMTREVEIRSGLNKPTIEAAGRRNTLLALIALDECKAQLVIANESLELIKDLT